MPYFQFHDEFLSAIGHNKVHAAIVTGLRLHIIETDTIDDGFEESEEQQAALFLEEWHGALAIFLTHEVAETGDHVLHVEFAIAHIVQLEW